MTIIPSRIDAYSVRIFLSFDKQSRGRLSIASLIVSLVHLQEDYFCTSEKSERRVHIGMRFMPTMQAVDTA